MKYIKRNIETIIKDYLKHFPVVVLTGPRQSGKTTTLKKILPEFQYISLDTIDIRTAIQQDIREFINSIKQPVIIDEAQHIPELFNYIKEIVDKNPNRHGRFILSGSSQFKLLSKISESLAGRAGIINLLPLDATEIPASYQDKHIIKGGYPKIAAQNGKNASRWFQSYIQTYIEKDIRLFLKVENLSLFRNFLDILALNCAKELNLSSLAKDAKISIKTVQNWISILEASFIVFLLPGYYSNLKKRITKRPKLFFFDTGLLCFLLGIENKKDLEKHPFKGFIFENYIVSEAIKICAHKDKNIKAYYLRDSHGIEIDLILLRKSTLNLIEIKHSHTARAEFTKSLNKIKTLMEEQNLPFKVQKSVVYKGETMLFGTKFLNYIDFFKNL